MVKKINTIELFAGCGGLVDGFEKTNKYNTLACVEWQENQCKVLKKRLKTKYGYNVEESVLRFDIQRTEELLHGWNDTEYGDNKGLCSIVNESIDMIIGGPPCQAYSIAGRVQVQDSMNNDYRNYLFESYLEVVKEFQPKLIVFENVEGLLTAKPNGINIVNRIREEFNNTGYEIIEDIRRYALLDLSEFGVPQKRKRIILVGLNKKYFKGDLQNILKEFYVSILGSYREDNMTVKDAISDLPKFFPSENEKKVGRKKYSHYPEKTNISDHYPRYHNKRDIEIFKELAWDIENKENKYNNIEALKKLYTERTGKESNIHKYNVLKWDKPSNTIPAHLKKDGLRHIHPDYLQARSITVREAARLQTFDDDFEFTGNASADYEMIGNAVPPKFSFKLANALYELIKKQELL